MESKITIPNHIDPDKFQELRRIEQDFLLALVAGKFTKTQLMKRFYIESERSRVRWKGKATACINYAKLSSNDKKA